MYFTTVGRYSTISWTSALIYCEKSSLCFELGDVEPTLTILTKKLSYAIVWLTLEIKNKID